MSEAIQVNPFQSLLPINKCDCGSNAVLHRDGIWWRVLCNECGMGGPFDLGASGAIEGWNHPEGEDDDGATT